MMVRTVEEEVLDFIGVFEEGVHRNVLNIEFHNISETDLDIAISKLLREGLIFEPRPKVYRKVE